MGKGNEEWGPTAAQRSMRQEKPVRYVKECVAVESNKAKIINLFHASKSQHETERQIQRERERKKEREREREWKEKAEPTA